MEVPQRSFIKISGLGFMMLLASGCSYITEGTKLGTTNKPPALPGMI